MRRSYHLLVSGGSKMDSEKYFNKCLLAFGEKAAPVVLAADLRDDHDHHSFGH